MLRDLGLGFPKISGTFLGGPNSKGYSLLGLMLRSSYLGKIPYRANRAYRTYVLQSRLLFSKEGPYHGYIGVLEDTCKWPESKHCVYIQVPNPPVYPSSQSPKPPNPKP